MDIRNLRYFLAVAEEMNFNRAARRLNISQPPLSRQIKLLEGELGVSLLERKGKRFRLTKAGEYLRQEATRVVETVEALERRVRIIGDGESRRVKIGYVGSIMFSILPDLLAYLKREMPDLSIDIEELGTEQQAEAILSGKIDLGFLRSWAALDGVQFEPLGEESLSIIYPTSLLEERAELGLSSFSEHAFVSLSQSSSPGLGERIREACSRAGFKPCVAYECGDFSSILKLVGAGLGWSIIPTFAFQRIAMDGVRLINLPDKVMFGLSYRSDVMPDRVGRIIELTRDFIQKIALVPMSGMFIMLLGY